MNNTNVTISSGGIINIDPNRGEIIKQTRLGIKEVFAPIIHLKSFRIVLIVIIIGGIVIIGKIIIKNKRKFF